MSNMNFSESSGLLDDTVEMVRSNKGGAKIIHRGYMYTVHKRRIGGIRWRCARRILHCKGSITTSAAGLPVINLPHNHVPDLHAVAQARCRSYGTPDDSLSGHAELLGLQLGPTAKYVATVPAEEYNQFNSAAEPMMEPAPPVVIKEEYFDEKPVFHSPSPAPSTTSLKSVKKTPPVPKLQNIKPAPVRLLKSTSSASSVAEEAEVCLRWNSHHSNMQTAFPSLMDEQKYVDVTLAAEGQIIKCHKLILSSCSTYFDDMLKSIEANQHPIIFIPKMEFWIVKALVEFMYKGEVNVDQSKLQVLIQSATELQIKGLAKQTSVKDEFEEPPPSENEEDAFSEYLPDSPSFVPDPEDDDFKPYNYSSKKNKKKPKKRKIPEPGQLKTVPCNLRGTKSRPNIKQPVFYDPDFPDHPYRNTSSPALVKEPTFDMDEIKMEPLDIEMPSSPTYYNNENHDFHENTQEKLPLLVELNSGNNTDFQEPPKKKSSLFVKETKNENHSPITIRRINNSIEKDLGVQLSLEKIQPNDETLKTDVQKKFCIRIVKSNNFEENKNELDKCNLKDISLEENLPSTSKMNDFTFKKIKLPTTESVLRKLAENKDDMISEEKDEVNCDSSKENKKDLSL